MKYIVKLGITLLIICAIAAFLLGGVNQITSPIIKERGVQANNELRKNVLNKATKFEKLDSSKYKGVGDGLVTEVYEGKDSSNKTVGYTIKTAPKGYGGKIDLTVGISTDGKITGISVGDMSETPGLGTKSKEPPFKNQFNGKKASQLEVVKGSTSKDNQIQAISGATITSKAVTKGVNAAIDVYSKALNK